MKKVLYVLHQKTSVPGDVGKKFKKRVFLAEIVRPPLGDNLPNDLSRYSAIVIFGGPMSVNDQYNDFIKYEMDWLKIVLESGKPFLGICLGAQMLAKHLGANVKKVDCNSSEIGFYEILPSEKGESLG